MRLEASAVTEITPHLFIRMNRRLLGCRRRPTQGAHLGGRGRVEHVFCARLHFMMAVALLAAGLPVAAVLCFAAALFHHHHGRARQRVREWA